MSERNQSLDAILDKSGPQQVDYLVDGGLKSESVLGANSVNHGLMSSLRVNRKGDASGIVRDMHPNDPAHRVDVANTIANKRFMVRKSTGASAPSALHIALDLPGRIEGLSGDVSMRAYGLFLLAITSTIASEAGSAVVVHANDGEKSQTIFDGYSDSIFLAYKALKKERKVSGESREGSTEGLLKLVNDRIDNDIDALVVVSDFQDGYDIDSDTFEWQQQMSRSKQNLDDRLWAVRVNSLAHREIPYGLIDGIDFSTIDSINREYASTAEKKGVKIQSILRHLPHVLEVDTKLDNNQSHPIRMMTKFMLGEPKI